MPDQTYNITIGDIHQGPAFFWPVLLPPTDGSRMLVDAAGNPKNPSATTWVTATQYAVGQSVWDGTNIQRCVLAGLSGTTPTWSTSPYPANSLSAATTAEGSTKPTWVNVGPPYSAGATEGACELTLDSKLSEVELDQETGAVKGLEEKFVDVGVGKQMYHWLRMYARR